MTEPTDAMVLAAARESWDIAVEEYGCVPFDHQEDRIQQQTLAKQRRILTAALAAAPVTERDA